MPDNKKLVTKKDDQDEKEEINYCTLCKLAQIPDCGDRTKDNSGWNNAEWGVYASEEERKAADLLRKNAVNLKTLNMEEDSKES
mmetsp:Transcript_25475/g.61357  ORF Transcript_25475/g.61357 Transcript_25475/m.61357 type:complete len:84 (-) Transcript_25475:196-447(-)|eukprot:CAMPEP_0114508478 /NCGR_PEP_ID=MMETSP0109-20121206/12629_1 /TAXON_ID=29199 /ORGANISM="Chlorarachnion reptans, Strain CCCM449" /LENGTH=83 /DNA_ID=CAMNT_0001687429 /DNA_START=210 /DNA_END=461 /DNA_ORIENTATION=-